MPGAGGSVESAAYSKAIVNKLTAAGIKNATYVVTERDEGGINREGRALRSLLNLGQTRAVHRLMEEYDRSDGQFNFIGYSMGSVDTAYAAWKLAASGQVIDNLILVGSPIKDDSVLMKQLAKQVEAGMIKKITRIDIPGDNLAPNFHPIQGPLDVLTKGDNAEHFKYMKNDKGQQDQLAEDVKKAGVK